MRDSTLIIHPPLMKYAKDVRQRVKLHNREGGPTVTLDELRLASQQHEATMTDRNVG
jgi:hypothetical protein